MELQYKRGNALKTIIAYLVIFNIISIFISLLIAYIYKGLGMNLKDNNTYYAASSLINFAVYVVLFSTLWFINKKDLILEVKEIKTQKDHIVLKILAAYGIFYAINIVGNSLISNIEYYADFANNVLGKHTEITSTANNQTTIVEILGGSGFITMFLAAGILGPICEEIVFRKAFFDLFKKKELALVFSSFCFALIHITSSFGSFNLLSIVLMTLPYLFSGVAFGYIYIKNDCKLFVPTAVHMLSNIVSMVMIVAMG